MSIERVVQNPDILHGKPAIKGTRIPVSLILNLLAHGATIEQVIEAYPQLKRKDILSAIEYASKLLNFEERILA